MAIRSWILSVPVLSCLGLAADASPQGRTERVSVASGGGQAGSFSYSPAISPDGRFVAFASFASNLSPGTGQGVFLRDRRSGLTELVSVASASGYASAGTCSVSADGRLVAYDAAADDLVIPDANGLSYDVYLYDRAGGTTERLSVDSSGVQGNADSVWPSITPDGRFVAFWSYSSNLVTADTNGEADVFVRDRVLATTERVNVSTAGQEAAPTGFDPTGSPMGPPRITPDGRWVVFQSRSPNLVAGDTNGYIDIFVRDRAAGTTERVSVGPGGVEANYASFEPSISDDGRFVAFASGATNLVAGSGTPAIRVYVHDRTTGVTELASGTAPSCFDPLLSGDGRFVAFTSYSPGIVPDDTNQQWDVFVHDRTTGSTVRASVSSHGRQGDGMSGVSSYAGYPLALSADGRFVAFVSHADDLVAGDTNSVDDVFVHDRGGPQPASYCTAKADSLGCLPAVGFSGTPSASGTAAFDVRASSVQSRRPGVLCYSLVPDLERFRGGVLCIAPPLRRTAIQDSGGNAGPHDCSGAFTYDFNARIRSGVDPDLLPGTVVYAQYVYRDPADPSGFGTGLSDALRFVVQP
jgi:Tol biopolymer transport system component